MKFWSIILLIFASAFTVMAQDAVLMEVVGKVEIKPAGGAWAAASAGTTVPLNATISTGFNSTAVFRVAGSILNVRPLTRMTLEEYRNENGQETASLNLTAGRVRASVRSTTDNQIDFTIRSPIATASVRGTDFDFDGFTLDVIEGLVDFGTNTETFVSVPAGGQSQASTNQPPAMPQEVKVQVAIVVTTTLPVSTPGAIGPTGTPPPADPIPVVTRDTIFGDTGSLVVNIR